MLLCPPFTESKHHTLLVLSLWYTQSPLLRAKLQKSKVQQKHTFQVTQDPNICKKLAPIILKKSKMLFYFDVSLNLLLCSVIPPPWFSTCEHPAPASVFDNEPEQGEKTLEIIVTREDTCSWKGKQDREHRQEWALRWGVTLGGDSWQCTHTQKHTHTHVSECLFATDKKA